MSDQGSQQESLIGALNDRQSTGQIDLACTSGPSPPPEKICTKCGERKPLTKYSPRNKTGSLHSRCQDCRKQDEKASRARRKLRRDIYIPPHDPAHLPNQEASSTPSHQNLKQTSLPTHSLKPKATTNVENANTPQTNAPLPSVDTGYPSLQEDIDEKLAAATDDLSKVIIAATILKRWSEKTKGAGKNHEQ